MLTPDEIAMQIYRDLNYEGRQEHVCCIIAAALQSYGDDRAAQERERCAQVVDQARLYWLANRTHTLNATYDPVMRERNIARARHWEMQCFRLAAAIRALS